MAKQIEINMCLRPAFQYLTVAYTSLRYYLGKHPLYFNVFVSDDEESTLAVSATGASAAAAGSSAAASAAAADVAVVVNPANPQSDISTIELTRVFRLDRQHWKAGGRIYLVLRESGAPSKELVLRRLYHMDSDELKRFWLGKLYRGEIASFPRVVSSDGLVKQIVSQAPNAIGFIDDLCTGVAGCP